MKPANINDMELGNILFGNSRGMYYVEPRMYYQDAFCKFLDANEFDMYGYHELTSAGSFETGTFILRPYYWGEDDEIAALPNFVYKPTGLEISWYKYPMRDAYSNQDVSLERFVEILADCERSMKEAT